MIKKFGGILLLVCLVLIFISSGEKPASEISVKTYNFDEIQPLLNKENDTVYVINFWATWCAPCVAEIPYFEKLGEKHSNRNLKILMVSLDFPNHLKSRLIPFIEKNKLKNEVVLLNDPDANRWIPLVDKDWSGVIPATLIYNKNKRVFIPTELSFEELETAVKDFF